jgi:hypothetical protein
VSSRAGAMGAAASDRAAMEADLDAVDRADADPTDAVRLEAAARTRHPQLRDHRACLTMIQPPKLRRKQLLLAQAFRSNRSFA